MAPASKAQQRAVAKYMKNNYDEIKVRMPKGKKEQIRTAAESAGKSLNSYINEAIDEKMQTEQEADA
ncbi:Arc family DNA-binding protein [Ruminococcus callidus]|jgi:predicted HicB family RNase H-like nuclease|uniref:Arc family DNA-binding protein n=1 Tax=Ruminococcus callidus TaxID=40519 RepID=UPI002674FC7D|nr:Arc family DNA-binding protein [uncultured Ruminococcus sp.]